MAISLKHKKELENRFPKKTIEDSLDYYQSQRNNFKTGDLIFFSGDHWLSTLIRWKSKSAWSHIGIVVKIDEIDKVFLLESTLETGVRMMPLSFVFSNYDGHNKPYTGRVAWARHEAFAEDSILANQIKNFCLDNLTKQYDRKEYWRILYRSFIGRKKRFKDDKFTCAEYVHEAFNNASIHIPRENGIFLSPGAFWRMRTIEKIAILI